MYQFKHILQYSSVLSPLVPIVLFFLVNGLNFKIEKSIKYLIVYLLVSFLTDLFCATLFLGRNNLTIIEIFAFVEIVFVLLIYMQFWMKINTAFQFKFVSVLIILFSFIALLPLNYLDDFKVYILACRELSIVLISVVYYFHLIDDVEFPVLTNNYRFWLSTAFFVYFSVFISIQLVKQYILDPNSSQSIKNLWMIHNFFHIVYNLLLALGIYQWKKMKI